MATSKKLKLKLLVDNEKKKVIFAESDKDFVDILFSFLTMPLGSIIRILNKQSSLGCMDKLYESVENLDESYFNTEACKEMLLRPLNANGELCEDLVLRIDESNPRKIFCCKKHECRTKSFPYFSLVPKSRCGCGEIMDFVWNWGKKEQRGPNGDGVFVKGVVNFIITDDLRVMPASTTNMHREIENLGIKDLDDIEETCFEFDAKMLRNLLKISLTSKSPISDVYFQKTNIIKNPQFRPMFRKVEDTGVDKILKEVKTKLTICKSSNKVLYIEAEEDFVDLLLSFLTFPLGFIVEPRLSSSITGCILNLHMSVIHLSYDTKYFKPDADMLLFRTKLAAHFGHNDSLFPSREKDILNLNLPDCHYCFMNKKCRVGTDCLHGVKPVNRTEMNPKLSSGKVGGSYVKKEAKFLITDDLQIKPFSTLCSFQTMKKRKGSFEALKEKKVYVNEHDALEMLKFCLNTQTPLSHVFLPKKQRRSSLI